ncbi:MAG TPA: hypothetical protein VFM46_19240, partial [Pseudomonadales bacterium]|nr:hypothetical protein [Pseudomonadales bacterium]
ADVLNEGFDIDATRTSNGATTSIVLLDPARTTINLPVTGSYQDSDASVGFRAFNQIATHATAYVDIRYHRQSIYDSTGHGLGARFGMRFSPIPSFSALKIGGFGDYTLTNVDTLELDNTADKVSLNLKKRSAGVEMLFDVDKFTIGATVERNQLIHRFRFKFDNYGSFDERFTDAAHISRVYFQYHFK